MTWNARLKQARTDAGLSAETANHRAWLILPEPCQRGIKTLERYERNWPEDKADPMYIAALCEVYGVRVADISLLIAERVRQLAGVASRNRWHRKLAARQAPIAA